MGRGKVIDTHMADENHAVVTVEATGSHYRREVCEECPWRKDARIGEFPAEAYRLSAPTAYDAAMKTFSCHMAGKERPQTCAGFLLAQGAHNLKVRLGQISGKVDLSKVRVTVPTYSTYREMAIANGVDPDDPAIARCRDDGQIVDF